MKTSFIVLSGAALAAAQSLSDLPPCGQTCVSNMIAIASSQFGCALGDVTCYCTNVDFGYGIRDCSNESCSASDAAAVIAFGTAYCQSALSGGGSPTLTSGALSTGTNTGAGATGTGASGAGASTGAGASGSAGAGGNGGNGGAGAAIPITTEALTNGKGKTTGSTTIYGIPTSTEALTNGKGKTTGTETLYSTATGAGAGGSMATGMSTSMMSGGSGMSTMMSSMGGTGAGAGGATTKKTGGSGGGATTMGGNGGNGNGGNGGNGGAGATSSSSTGGAALATAVPAFLGAAAMAILAL